MSWTTKAQMPGKKADYTNPQEAHRENRREQLREDKRDVINLMQKINKCEAKAFWNPVLKNKSVFSV